MPRLLSQFINYMEVDFLPVYIPNKEEQLNAKLFANNVKKVMSTALGNCPMTEHNYDDTVLIYDGEY